MQNIRIDGERRRLIKLVGAGLALGTLGVGSATAGTGRYVVGTASRGATREARSKARSVHRVLDFGRHGQAVSGQFSREALDALARRADVRYVEPDGFVYAVGGTGDIDSTDPEVPWGVDRVDAEKVHTASTGSGADVAIIDTGIDNDHPDLAVNLGAGVSFTVGPPWSDATSTDPADWDDGNGHGTHCAGIAAAVDNDSGVVGIATQPTLHAVKVLDNSGRGSYSDVAAGIKYVADQGWHVGSLSLSGGLSDTIKDACDYAYGKGVLLVAAAGNDGEDVANFAPAAYVSVVAVSATKDDDTTPSWSNWGDEIELAAPGVAIYSTYKGGSYDTLSGTSMACPHVAGAGGILMGAGYTNIDARTRLQSTAEDLGAGGRDIYYGYGLLDVEAAVGSTDGGDTGDTTAPSAPTLSEDGHTDTSVSLSWTTPSDSDLSGFNLYTKLASDSTYAKEGTYDASTTSTTVSGLSADTSYDFYVTAFDTSGNESDPSNVVTVKTDASSGSTGDGTAPTIDRFDASEAGSPNPHANVTVDWAVSDTLDDGTAGNLSSVDVAVAATDGSYSDAHTHAVSGASASGSDSFEIKWGGGKDYDVTLTVTDAAGNSASQTKTVAAV